MADGSELGLRRGRAWPRRERERQRRPEGVNGVYGGGIWKRETEREESVGGGRRQAKKRRQGKRHQTATNIARWRYNDGEGGWVLGTEGRQKGGAKSGFGSTAAPAALAPLELAAGVLMAGRVALRRRGAASITARSNAGKRLKLHGTRMGTSLATRGLCFRCPNPRPSSPPVTLHHLVTRHDATQAALRNAARLVRNSPACTRLGPVLIGPVYK
ncbi:hypothetical protein IWX47DRAFT_94450 [Phyllosticta citricarpa]